MNIENYKELALEYKVMKKLAIDMGLSANQFLNEINNRTYLGKFYLKFFEKVADNGNVEKAIFEFVEIVYGVKASQIRRTPKKDVKN